MSAATCIKRIYIGNRKIVCQRHADHWSVPLPGTRGFILTHWAMTEEGYSIKWETAVDGD